MTTRPTGSDVIYEYGQGGGEVITDALSVVSVVDRVILNISYRVIVHIKAMYIFALLAGTMRRTSAPIKYHKMAAVSIGHIRGNCTLCQWRP